MKTKAGRDTQEAEQRIAVRAQPRSTCGVCKGKRNLKGLSLDFSRNHATIRCEECRGEGTVPAGNLAQWREEAMALVTTVAKQATKLGQELRDIEPKELLGEPICTGRSMAESIVELGDHLAAMPAQADPDAELLGALREIEEMEIAIGQWPQTVLKMQAIAQAAIAQAEKGAAG